MAKVILFSCLFGLLLGGCRTIPASSRVGSDGRDEWIAWQKKRLESVAGTNGWTTVVGLHWLREGRQSAGANPTNDVVLASLRVGSHIGWFVRDGFSVRFEPAKGISALAGGRLLSETGAHLESDAISKPTVLEVGGVRMVVLKRGDRIGVRVRDPESAARRGFRGIPVFPYDPSWRMEGRFEVAPSGETLLFEDVIGGIQEFPVPGRVVFMHRGREYRLVAVQEPDEEDYFVVFRDQSAGETTYPAGRFLYVAKPDSNGRVVIDFNRAYTPPCGFTSFATCPLPPRENRLPFPIKAGEKRPIGH